jgi:hypothetical protein
MGGSNDPSNIVELTVEEHADAHRLLWEKHGKWQDEIAWKALSGIIGKEDIITEVQRKTHLGKNKKSETKQKISDSLTGRKQSQETIEKRRKKLIGKKRKFTDEWKKNISKSKKGQIPWIAGKKQTEESKLKNSLAHIGHTYNRGRVHSDESRKNMSIAHRGQTPYNKGMKYDIVECPYCKKIGGSNSMKRYHFDNCKNKT